MDIEEARNLLDRYNAGLCTEEEMTLVENSFLQYNEHEIDIPQERIDEIRNEIYAELPIHKKKTRNITLLWLGAASVAAIALLTIGGAFIFDNFILPTKEVLVQDVRPGGNKATILLPNGKVIDLNSDKNAVVINGNNLTYADGTTVDMTGGTSLAVQTLSTPNGGQYQIILSDGTKVWLNAASSLTYPASFASVAQRKVDLVGEAYFEVAPNKNKPFIVRSSNQTVEVLGTHFNINDYKDDGNTITTLTEGSVKVGTKSSQNVILKPNQQSLINHNAIKVQDADVKTALAWKNGKIEFRDASIQTIMKQISRWYDIDIEYRGDIPQRTFNGGVSRQSNLSVLLKILAYSDINFVIEKDQNSRNKLIVTP